MEEKELIVGRPSYLARIILLLIGGGMVVIGMMRNSASKYPGDFVELLIFDGDIAASAFFDIGLIVVIIGLFFFFSYAKVSLTVTNKRVYGTANWGKRVDLPIDSISAVAVSAFKGIAVATSSGNISFKGIENNNEVHKTISDLLIGRQDTKASTPQTTIKQEIPQSNADELKKFKELLDSGVITQEEFDAKKKKLLGL